MIHLQILRAKTIRNLWQRAGRITTKILGKTTFKILYAQTHQELNRVCVSNVNITFYLSWKTHGW